MNKTKKLTNNGGDAVADLDFIQIRGDSPQISYNTYLMLTPLFKALIISSDANGKYDLKVNDNKNGFYFYYSEGDLSIKVPLTAIFNTNDKIRGILGVAFSTARDDLKADLFNMINKHDNIILNGSNIMYNNLFNAVDNIRELLTADYQCRGGCLKNGCLNCYKLKGVIITVLIHGSQAGRQLNTADNRAFISQVLKLEGINISEADLKRGVNIYRNLKREMIKGDYFKLVPTAFLKVNNAGDLIFDSQGAVINYLRHILNKHGVNAEDI